MSHEKPAARKRTLKTDRDLGLAPGCRHLDDPAPKLHCGGDCLALIPAQPIERGVRLWLAWSASLVDEFELRVDAPRGALLFTGRTSAWEFAESSMLAHGCAEVSGREPMVDQIVKPEALALAEVRARAIAERKVIEEPSLFGVGRLFDLHAHVVEAELHSPVISTRFTSTFIFTRNFFSSSRCSCPESPT